MSTHTHIHVVHTHTTHTQGKHSNTRLLLSSAESDESSDESESVDRVKLPEAEESAAFQWARGNLGLASSL